MKKKVHENQGDHAFLIDHQSEIALMGSKKKIEIRFSFFKKGIERGKIKWIDTSISVGMNGIRLRVGDVSDDFPDEASFTNFAMRVVYSVDCQIKNRRRQNFGTAAGRAARTKRAGRS